MGLAYWKMWRKHPYVMEKTWFPVDFPLNQSIEYMIATTNHIYQTPLAPRSGPADAERFAEMRSAMGAPGFFGKRVDI